ncbi:MAG TPA: pitrilysin family protein [Anaeromyxobacteraceae bacterium]|nr:pitrilysin family protein [Anaeromyxobacteraceae bacterium]
MMTLALLALLAASPPGSPTLEFETFRLENGLTVIVHEDHAAPIVAVHVQYDVGSKEERPGRTGFAHLFEHLMFQATAHLAKGEMDRVVESAGGESNGSTSQDTTVYWSQAPANALEQLLYVESERMGFLLPALTLENLDNQREVVRNERRESYEMRPYGTAWMKLMESLWNPEFPYHWMPIGSHQDLEAATLEDVREFFARWYGPRNAVLAVAGDVEPARVRVLVERWFGTIPGGTAPAHEHPEPRPLASTRRVSLEDDVQLPRLYLAWQTPALYRPGDAALDVLGAILSDGKSSRLVRRLEMEEQIAQSVFAGQSSQALASAFLVVATPKPGVAVERIEREVDEEIARIAREPPAAEELQRAKNKIESSAVFGLEPVGGFGGRAAKLADYTLKTGNPGYLDEDLARYRAVTAADVSEAARRWLGAPRVSLTVVPRAGGRGSAGAAGKEAVR